MVKKIFAVLAILAALAWTVDIALTVSQGAASPALFVKVVLIACFVYYAYRVFFAKHKDKSATTPVEKAAGG